MLCERCKYAGLQLYQNICPSSPQPTDNNTNPPQYMLMLHWECLLHGAKFFFLKLFIRILFLRKRAVETGYMPLRCSRRWHPPNLGN